MNAGVSARVCKGTTRQASSKAVETDPRVLALHNSAETPNILILGNGPSLVDQLDLLRQAKAGGLPIFTCNGYGSWIGAPEPTYHGVSDVRTWKGLEKVRYPHWQRTLRFNVQFERDSTGDTDWAEHEGWWTVKKAPDNIQVSPHGLVGFGDELEPIPTARTTPMTLISLAIWLGYRDFYLAGVEQTRGYAWNPNETKSSIIGAEFPLDKNPRYQLSVQRNAKKIREDIEANGGSIYDCTPNGLLNGRTEVERGFATPEILQFKPLEEVVRDHA
jgi:hypothetical protein